ncbi:MAG TPA: DUF1062 domain-containing protein [Pseudonocardiaceae bacterium]|nr:DUF1062 domain-containing protein [Pseudonocardiaceae bacterium]
MRRTAMPLIRRQCLTCASSRYQATGAFRVNANGKQLDIWLLATCVRCEQTIKLEILERVHVRTVDPTLLDQLHRNDAGLVLQLLTDPAVLRRNAVTLDWQDAWELRADPVDLSTCGAIETLVSFEHRIPVRLARLLAQGLRIPRTEAERLITAGRITSTCRLGTTVSTDFSFTLHCHPE